jgi:hypothetical protein
LSLSLFGATDAGFTSSVIGAPDLPTGRGYERRNEVSRGATLFDVAPGDTLLWQSMALPIGNYWRATAYTLTV